MSSRHLLDSELAAIIDFYPPLDLSMEALPAIRQNVIDFLPPAEVPADIIFESVRVPGLNGAPEVELLTYRPAAVTGSLPVILHIHGGGYVMGWPEGGSGANIRTAQTLGCMMVVPRYRLAPETVAPGGLEDCYAGLKWLYNNAASLGIDTTRIAVAGESAGGGMAAALAIYARDKGEVPICFQSLMYPMLDDRAQGGGNAYAGEFVWTRESNDFGWCALLGGERGGEGVSPYAAAARAEDLSGLPSTFIAVGSVDLFLEEDVTYATRLTRAGVPTELHVYPGGYHAFDVAAHTAIAIKAEADRLDALRRAFARN